MMTTGYMVVYAFNTQGGGIKGQPVTRDGHFKVYGTKAAADRRRYHIGSRLTRVVPVNWASGE